MTAAGESGHWIIVSVSGGSGSKVLVRTFAFQPLAGLSVGGKVSTANLTGVAQAICGAWWRTMPAGNV